MSEHWGVEVVVVVLGGTRRNEWRKRKTDGAEKACTEAMRDRSGSGKGRHGSNEGVLSWRLARLPGENSSGVGTPQSYAEGLPSVAEDSRSVFARSGRNSTGKRLEDAHCGRAPSSRGFSDYGKESEALLLAVHLGVEVVPLVLFIRRGGGPALQRGSGSDVLPVRRGDSEIQSRRHALFPGRDENVSWPPHVRPRLVRRRLQEPGFLEFRGKSGRLSEGAALVSDGVVAASAVAPAGARQGVAAFSVEDGIARRAPGVQGILIDAQPRPQFANELLAGHHLVPSRNSLEHVRRTRHHLRENCGPVIHVERLEERSVVSSVQAFREVVLALLGRLGGGKLRVRVKVKVEGNNGVVEGRSRSLSFPDEGRVELGACAVDLRQGGDKSGVTVPRSGAESQARKAQATGGLAPLVQRQVKSRQTSESGTDIMIVFREDVLVGRRRDRPHTVDHFAEARTVSK